MNSAMGGIFNAPNNRFRPPMPVNGQSNTPPAPSNDSATGRIMPPGNAMGAPQDAQNSFMPQGATAGPGTPGSGIPTPPPMQTEQQPLTQPSYNTRAPIMDPNDNFKLDALKAGVLNQQNPVTFPGTPTQNTPSTNMQNVPYLLNQLKMGANAPTMQ